jgi:flagellar hook protein FlgE
MIRSMFSAISGLRNHQTMMDVVGNNISNVNTTGFKTSSVVFQDVLSQTLRGSGQPATAVGGTSPAQVGLGSRVAAITTNFGQGALQRTGRATDMAIQGDGFFTVSLAGQQLFTRAGAFSVDATGNLATQDGAFVQGWQANVNGVINANASASSIRIPVGDLISPVVTSTVNMGGNLPANAAVGSPPIVASVDVYDTQGAPVTVTLSFAKSAANQWTVTGAYGNPPTAIAGLSQTLTFDVAGELTAPAGRSFAVTGVPGIASFNFDLGAAGAANRITQFANVNSVAALAQNGSGAGSLQSFTVSQDGLVVGAYSNGRSKQIAQLSLANFTNPEGLEKVGGSNFRATVNSGLPQLGVAGLGGRGLLSSGTVEMSNVDLAQEFTNLIIAQRGFQANSRVVSSADELLQEIVNLKR